MHTPEPRVLEGVHVRLEPLTRAHAPRLAEVGLAEELWRLSSVLVRTPAEMHAYVDAALEEQRRGASLPFAIVERSGGRAVGSTRYGNIAPAHGRLEIGWTWVAPAWQRTAVNTEAKYLLLRYAFETLGCGRVELKTDALNQRSRAAIRRLGATEEGTLRRHMRTSSGRLRDTVYYSILDDEWPDVKRRLEERLMGGPDHILVVLKEIREKIGKGAGDEVAVVLEEDRESRTVEVPEDLGRALRQDPEARELFERLAYTHRKEYVRWIEGAKREQTRRDRIERAVRMLREGKKAR